MNSRHRRQYIFFLGGHDAEMCEIRRLLDEKGIEVIDGKLNWETAKLSSYRQEIKDLPNNKKPVFIELNVDDPEILRGMKEDYIIVDHHGDKAGNDKKTSLEQVIELLGIPEDEITKRQKLISANDKGHIRAMQAMCATPEEIQEIRAYDMKCQGILKGHIEAADTYLKEKGLEKRPDKVGKYIILDDARLFSTTPVSDRIWDWYRHIFFINDKDDKKTLTYNGTGEGVEALKALYKEKFGEDAAFWFGGALPAHGYFGSKQIISKEEIEKIMEGKIKEDKYFSHHIFMFPFKFDNFSTDKEESFLEYIDKFFRTKANNPELGCVLDDDNKPVRQWKKGSYKIDNCKNWRYNEFFYFYDFVRNSVFDIDCQEKSNKPKKSKVSYFKRAIDSNATYTIRLKSGQEYSLRISHIKLHIFETKVGILTIVLENYQTDEIEDILRINDYGRRIYPQFIGDNGTSDTKFVFLADSIAVRLNKRECEIEDFDTKAYWQNKLQIGKHIHTILGDRFCEKFHVTPIIDDRMYTVTWYRNGTLMSHLKERICDEYRYETDDTWYRLIFSDGSSKTIAHKKMQKALTLQSTYGRWVEDGALFGFSRYGLIALVGKADSGFDYGYDILRQHMRRMYYQMAVILLMQRASMLAFSDRVSEISGRIRDNIKGEKKKENVSNSDNMDKVLEDIRDLDGDMIHFVNRLWFTEVTPQEQGIEMYAQAQKVMNLKEQMADLKSEIQELYDYARLQEENENNKLMTQLTILGTIFLPLSLVTGIWGMNLIFDSGPHYLIQLGVSLFFIFIATFASFQLIRINREKSLKLDINRSIKRGLLWFMVGAVLVAFAIALITIIPDFFSISIPDIFK